MPDGDIQGGSMGDIMSSFGKGVSSLAGGVSDVVGLFRGSSSSQSQNSNQNINITNTTQEEVSDEKARAILEKLLGATDGLAALTSGQKAAGVYNSTVNTQLVNDLLGSVAANVASLSKKVTTTQAGTVDNSTTSTQKKKGALEWIVCTELYKQGKMPHKFYHYGARVFAAHSDKTKQGYYLWAVPAVMHLRKHPDSLLSKLLEILMVARAEYVAAKGGCKSARKTFFGFAVAKITYAICVILSRTFARKPIDWFSKVYTNALEK